MGHFEGVFAGLWYEDNSIVIGDSYRHIQEGYVPCPELLIAAAINNGYQGELTVLTDGKGGYAAFFGDGTRCRWCQFDEPKTPEEFLKFTRKLSFQLRTRN
ncbi:MAG: hypothetical protein GW780_05465 [Candidatus Aenigmarchaeota archaeon]|nr:hypothetical protein [Candidatus Aenigmarchaeota archaeon]OIN86951.1 MAG: hypothetical protein AUJ50_03355 [Candidatus Aenigmarchaeota archaeon CG1_02_38_14]PIY36007.1 MAG: hypothetical protein COZ04_01595 [Candidatus Aenigmarchaeota archaeon CG_4_10_14_3_um_filter_37_21]